MMQAAMGSDSRRLSRRLKRAPVLGRLAVGVVLGVTTLGASEVFTAWGRPQLPTSRPSRSSVTPGLRATATSSGYSESTRSPQARSR
eukprot:s1128_g21.t1